MLSGQVGVNLQNLLLLGQEAQTAQVDLLITDIRGSCFSFLWDV